MCQNHVILRQSFFWEYSVFTIAIRFRKPHVQRQNLVENGTVFGIDTLLIEILIWAKTIWVIRFIIRW